MAEVDSLIQPNDILDDRYKIIEVAGAGGMATVYRAHDIITDKDVAIKVLHRDRASSPTNLSRFDREARAAACLNHPNIVKVLNVGNYQGLPYIVNEYIRGQNLHEVLEVRGKLANMESLDIMFQLSSAVMYAHEHGVIHRDIKPQNIFLTSEGTVKLGDFGIATFQNSSHVTQSEVVIGSIQYLAPECCNGRPASTRSDIYSMGITFFEIVTGSVPFDSDTTIDILRKQIYEKLPSVRKFNPKCPEAMEAIIEKACNKDPLDRYASAELMRKDIERLLKNPSLLEEKPRFFFFSLFHSSPSAKKEKEKKKALAKVAKKAKQEEKL